MKLKDEEFVVDPDEPFKNDALERKDIAINLAQFLISLDIPFVMSINSRWGTGKTTFVKMLQQHLKNNKVPTLYFNAWESDFTDPLIAFISEIQEQIVNDLEDKDAKARERFEKAKKIGLSVAKHALPAAVKAATAGLINLDEMTEEILSGMAEGLAKASLEEFQAAKKSIGEFRTQLEQFANDIKDGTPIIIFVDELDRCRPPYAIALLERIKHLFNVPGIVFVLILDRSELANVISAHYGLQDTTGYLIRFIDLEYKLPDPSIEQYARLLFERLGINSFFRGRARSTEELDYFQETFIILAKTYNCKLRGIERSLTQVVLVLLTTGKDDRRLPTSSLALLAILKIQEPKIYDRFIRNDISGIELIENIKKLPGITDFFLESISIRLEVELLVSFKDTDELEQIISMYELKVNNGELSEMERKRAEQVMNALTQHYHNHMFRPIDMRQLINKIDLADNLVNLASEERPK